jgi:hypothetical protein
MKKYSTISIVYPNMNLYNELQAIISIKYYEIYGARINPTPDLFIFLDKSLSNDTKAGSCFGVTMAKNKKLFSEIYIDNPIDKTISHKLQRNVIKDCIAEIGSFISFKHQGAGRELASIMNEILFLYGIDYILITVTQKLLSIFFDLNLNFIKLKKAFKSRLSIQEQNKWGTYYNTNPITGFIPIRDYIKTLVFNSIQDHYTRSMIQQIETREIKNS